MMTFSLDGDNERMILFNVLSQKNSIWPASCGVFFGFGKIREEALECGLEMPI